MRMLGFLRRFLLLAVILVPLATFGATKSDLLSALRALPTNKVRMAFFGGEDPPEAKGLDSNFFHQLSDKLSALTKEFAALQNVSEAERFEFAKLLAERSPDVLVKFKSELFFADRQKRLELARVSARADDNRTAGEIQWFQLERNERFNLAKEMLLAFPDDDHTPCVAEYIDRFDLDLPQRKEIAELGLKKEPNWVGSELPKFNLPLKDRQEIGWKLLNSESVPPGLAERFSHFGITDPGERFRFFSKLAEVDALGMMVDFSKLPFSFTPEQRIVFARKLAQHGYGFPSFVRDFQITDPNIRYELALESARNPTSNIAESIENFELKDPKQRYEVALVDARTSPANCVENVQNYGFQDWVENRLRLRAISTRPEDAILAMAGVKPEEFITPEKLTEICQQVQKKHPGLLPESLLSNPFAVVKRRSAAMGFIGMAARLGEEEAAKGKTLDAAFWSSIAKHPLDVLASAFGVRRSQIEHLPERHLSVLAELGGDIARLAPKWPTLQGFAIDPDFFEKKHVAALEDFLVNLRDHLSFLKENERLAVFRELTQTHGRLSLGNIKSVQSFLEQALVADFQRVFSTAGHKVNLTAAQIRQLRTSWGDFSIPQTLAARFNAEQKWSEELPELARILEASANGDFSSLKFHGDATDPRDQELARTQLGPIADDERKLAAWRRRRFLAEVVDASPSGQSATVAAQENLKPFLDTLSTNLIPHLSIESLNPVVDIPIQRSLRELLATFRGDPKEFFRRVLVLFGENSDHLSFKNEKILLSVLLSELSTRDLNPELRVKHLGTLENLLRLKLLSMPYSPQLQADIKELKARAKAFTEAKRIQVASRKLVVTVNVNDAKNLMKVGDWVDCASCQNYRTGSHIETLLGYVKDANIQATLSHALEARDFDNSNDFAVVADAAQEGRLKGVRLAENSNVFEFEISEAGGQEARTIRSAPVEKVLRRHVVRLGTISGEVPRPAVFMERAYSQVHPLEGTMETQAKRLVYDMATAIGAETQGEMKFGPSRNAGGVYSDASTGSQRWSYTINVDESPFHDIAPRRSNPSGHPAAGAGAVNCGELMRAFTTPQR